VKALKDGPIQSETIIIFIEYKASEDAPSIFVSIESGSLCSDEVSSKELNRNSSVKFLLTAENDNSEIKAVVDDIKLGPWNISSLPLSEDFNVRDSVGKLEVRKMNMESFLSIITSKEADVSEAALE